MYVNAHDHMDFYKEDLDQALKIIEEKQIYSLACSTDIASYKFIKSLNSEYIIAGFGIHPWKLDAPMDLNSLRPYIEEADFLGEIGLDFHWVKDRTKDSYQIEVFKYFLKEAKRLNKLTNIHTKGAEELILELLKLYRVPSPIIHWYSGDLDLVDQYLNLGSYFTISVDAAYSETTNKLIEKLPLDRILTETDGISALEWIRGEKSYPDYIEKIISHIARVKKLSYEEVRLAVFKNFKSLNIKKDL